MAAIMLLALPLAGCVTDDSKTAVNPITTQVTQVQNDLKNTQADVKALQDSVSKKVDLSTVTDLIKTAGAAGASSGYSKAETYTRAEVDGLLLALKMTSHGLREATAIRPIRMCHLSTTGIIHIGFIRSRPALYMRTGRPTPGRWK